MNRVMLPILQNSVDILDIIIQRISYSRSTHSIGNVSQKSEGS